MGGLLRVLFLGAAFRYKAARLQCAPHGLHRAVFLLLVDGRILHCTHGTPREVLHALSEVSSSERVRESGYQACGQDCSGAGKGPVLLPRLRSSLHAQRAQGFLLQATRELPHPALPWCPVPLRLPPDDSREDGRALEGASLRALAQGALSMRTGLRYMFPRWNAR